MPILAWGVIIIGTAVLPYILPPPAATDPPATTDNGLFRLSLILGIAISAFTLYSYVRKGI